MDLDDIDSDADIDDVETSGDFVCALWSASFKIMHSFALLSQS
jgi:hypothetical protein